MSVNVGRMRIGEVHTLLRQDYPDIELSKIRYYEDKGLVRPSRSRKGYRLYSERDVACLREAIRLAQDEFVPLRVVRLRLMEQGLLNDVAGSPVTRQAARGANANVVSITAPSSVVADPPGESPRSNAVTSVDDDAKSAPAPTPSTETAKRWTFDEFLRATGLSASNVAKLESLGLLVPINVAHEVVFSAVDVRVGESAEALLTRGVDARFLGSLRRVVEREVGVIDDLTWSLRQPGSHIPPEQVQSVVESVSSEVGVLRAVLLERALQEYFSH